MTREVFEKSYCKRSNITLEQYREWFVTLPCACDYEGCQRWAAVHNSPDAIKAHLELYAPKEIDNG